VQGSPPRRPRSPAPHPLGDDDVDVRQSVWQCDLLDLATDEGHHMVQLVRLHNRLCRLNDARVVDADHFSAARKGQQRQQRAEGSRGRGSGSVSSSGVGGRPAGGPVWGWHDPHLAPARAANIERMPCRTGAARVSSSKVSAPPSLRLFHWRTVPQPTSSTTLSLNRCALLRMAFIYARVRTSSDG
jgi:hypothetical protein